MESVVYCKYMETDCQYYVSVACGYVSRAFSNARDKIFQNGDKIRYDRCALGKTDGTEFRNPQAQFYSESQITKEKGVFVGR
jgi:hypothetical protein